VADGGWDCQSLGGYGFSEAVTRRKKFSRECRGMRGGRTKWGSCLGKYAGLQVFLGLIPSWV